jgi:hypothetical protein
MLELGSYRSRFFVRGLVAFSCWANISPTRYRSSETEALEFGSWCVVTLVARGSGHWTNAR